jgi:NADPH:quinone reductase-like Zn-dependent oxidoreductase
MTLVPKEQETMRQIWMNGKGEVDVMAVREVPRPEPGAGQVRIAVEAAGVNFADVMMRLGLYPDAPKLPAVAGYEVAGTVDAVGAGVAKDLTGTPVVAMCNFGGYSEFVCRPHDQVWSLPAGVSSVSAAALPVNYLTAWQMIRVMAPVTEGDLVLIHSAAGGVGQAVIQLCGLTGARVIGSASPPKHAGLLAQGLEYVFDSRRTDFAQEVKDATAGRGVDVALEPRHGRWIMESYRSLAKCGRLVLFGFSSAAQGKGSGTLSALRTLAQVPWFGLNPIRLMNDNKLIGGVNLGRMWDQQERTSAWMTGLLELLTAGSIAPVIDSVFDFDDVGLAHRRLEDRSNVGKVILVPRKGASA